MVCSHHLSQSDVPFCPPIYKSTDSQPLKVCNHYLWHFGIETNNNNKSTMSVLNLAEMSSMGEDWSCSLCLCSHAYKRALAAGTACHCAGTCFNGPDSMYYSGVTVGYHVGAMTLPVAVMGSVLYHQLLVDTEQNFLTPHQEHTIR